MRWGGGCEGNLPLNSLSTVIRPSGLAHMHPHAFTHGTATGENASIFLILSPLLHLIQIVLSVCQVLAEVKPRSKAGD